MKQRLRYARKQKREADLRCIALSESNLLLRRQAEVNKQHADRMATALREWAPGHDAVAAWDEEWA